ncbi:MAG: hypothetical protein GTN39_00575 [Candidatus Aenigmarchaeota archaeon]|nr:hypothetical protein [Candidatus Aenigmarchaeota archaeon]
MRVSILIVVTVVVILIIAVVLLTIFGGGIERWLQIWGVFSTEQLALSRCQTRCQELCTNTGTRTGQPPGWGDGTVKVGGAEYSCSQYGFTTCDCSKYVPGGLVSGTTTKLKVGQPCDPANPSQCETGKCDPIKRECVN